MARDEKQEYSSYLCYRITDALLEQGLPPSMIAYIAGQVLMQAAIIADFPKSALHEMIDCMWSPITKKKKDKK